MAFNMQEEEDLLDSRPKTKMFSRKMRSDRSVASQNMSVRSSASSSTVAIDARLLSHATNQATIAARSILVSSGTEETALKTAKAAAQSVLITHHEALLTKGPKGMLLKRKIKKQAEVVASMALVTATNAIRNNQWDTLPEDDLRMMQLNSEGGSTISSLPPPTPKSRKAPLTPFEGSTYHASTGSLLIDTIEEEEDSRSLHGKSPIQSFLSSHASSDQEMIHRPVAIRVETKGGHSRRAPSRRQRDLAHDVPDEDPIYALPDSPNGSETSDDDDDDDDRRDDRRGTRNHADLDLISTASADSSIADDDTLGTAGTTGTTGTQASFLQNVDPYIFSFTNVFRCFESTPAADAAAKDAAATDTDEQDGRSLANTTNSHLENGVNSFIDHDPSHGASEDSRDDRFFSQQGTEDSDGDDEEDDDDHDEDRGISQSQDTESSGESYDERPMSRKSKLRQKMKRIIGRNSRRNVSQSISESSEEDREQYSSDSREDAIESGGSSESSGSSSSDEEQERRYRKKTSGFSGWRSRRQRRDSATKGVHT